MKTLVINVLCAVSISCAAADGVCIRHLVAPVYPPLPLQARIQGSVVLDLIIAADGEVTSVSASGAHRMLQKAAEENIRTWMFCGALAAQNIRITYSYKLENEARYPVPPPKIIFDLPEKVEIVSYPPIPDT